MMDNTPLKQSSSSLSSTRSSPSKTCPPDPSVMDFKRFISSEAIYVDKTMYIYALLKSNEAVTLLLRPRRFGKSLLLSTLKYFFLGERELFKGLYIDKQAGVKWKKYPVIHLDMTLLSTSSSEDVQADLNIQLESVEEKFNIQRTSEYTSLNRGPNNRFVDLLEDIYRKEGKKVVVLVDEYEAPMTATMNKPFHDDVVSEMTSFYSALKSSNKFIKFAFLTGVSTMRKDMNSGFNNAINLHQLSDFATVCGFTDAEIDTYFKDLIASIADKKGITEEACRDAMRRMYNGYNFDKHFKQPKVYNPVSVALFLKAGLLRNYWSDTGRSTYFTELIKDGKYGAQEVLLQNTMCLYKDPDVLSPGAILYQSGYLTLSKVTSYGELILDFPNEECRSAYLDLLAEVDTSLNTSSFSIESIRDLITTGDIKGFVKTLSVLFSKIPYHIHMRMEKNFQVAVYMYLLAAGFKVDLELMTDEGRLDCTYELNDSIYIFEFKIDKTAKIAINQIWDRGYCTRYLLDGKKIFCVGINFQRKNRSAIDYKHYQLLDEKTHRLLSEDSIGLVPIPEATVKPSEGVNTDNLSNPKRPRNA